MLFFNGAVRGAIMSRNITINAKREKAMEEQATEIVERKGIGHPDSVADGIAEAVSRTLSRYYRENYGRIFHHNTDQVEIVGGQAKAAFRNMELSQNRGYDRGGMVLEPVYILLSGRATTTVDIDGHKERVPYRTLAKKAAFEQLKSQFPNLDPVEDVIIDCKIGQGSVDLKGLYDTDKKLANDTSFGVGYAPLSEVDTITLKTEEYIIEKLRHEMKALGEDIKVMTSRNGDNIHITVAQAMVGKYLDDSDAYQSVKEELKQKLLDNAVKYTGRKVDISINTGDIPENDIYYLTVTGLSMENGDDGSVGRGNRVNGLITPYRPMSMEAAAGKNPVTHVGKIYNLMSKLIAEDIIKAGGNDIKEAHVRLVSNIGQPISEPQLASVQLIMAEGVSEEKYRSEINGIVENWLDGHDRITDMLLEEKLKVF